MTTEQPGLEPRVLQVVLSLNPGGTERLVLDLVDQLMPSVPMAVCCLDEVGTWGTGLQDRGVVVAELRRPSGFRPSIGHGVAKAAERHRATVIHAHHYTPFVYSCLSRWWRPRMPIVYTEHGRLSDGPPSPRRRMVNPWLRRIPSAIYAVSEDLREFMATEGFSRQSVGVIYNGIAIGPLPTPAERQAVRAELGLADNVLVVGTIARLDPVKDLGTLLRAAVPLVRDRPTVVVIVGDGPERARLAALADELNLRDSIRFLGQRHDARRWLAGCDVYVNCSTSEGVSLTILEAMAAGLPVVVTRVGGTPEVVPESCGVLIPARNPQALADAIRSIAADPAAARARGLTGRANVESRFTIERMARDYADVYRSLGAAPGVER